MGTQPVPENIALSLAVEFHTVYERLAPSFGYATRQDTRQFDPESANGKLMTAVCSDLIRSGYVLTPMHAGGVWLNAIKDGRRSKRDFPDFLKGWQYLGMLNVNGKPRNAPLWAAERVRCDLLTGTAYLHSTDSCLPRELFIGDWVVRHDDPPHQGNARVYRLNAESVGKWYRTDGSHSHGQ